MRRFFWGRSLLVGRWEGSEAEGAGGEIWNERCFGGILQDVASAGIPLSFKGVH